MSGFQVLVQHPKRSVLTEYLGSANNGIESDPPPQCSFCALNSTKGSQLRRSAHAERYALEE